MRVILILASADVISEYWGLYQKAKKYFANNKIVNKNVY
jgi:hypothetical protein